MGCFIDGCRAAGVARRRSVLNGTILSRIPIERPRRSLPRICRVRFASRRFHRRDNTGLLIADLSFGVDRSLPFRRFHCSVVQGSFKRIRIGDMDLSS